MPVVERYIHPMRPSRPAGLILSLVLTGATAAPFLAQQAQPPAAADPFLWLEDVEGEKAMAWVKAKNAATLAELERSPVDAPVFERSRKILNDRIYNFWQDDQHQRGIWRRTSLGDYVGGASS
jgi:prolyl oligopeptidase